MNSSPSGIVELLRAIDFAAERHRNQRRKDDESSPYVNHPIRVAATLALDGGISELTDLQAAVLHDTIEDTETTPEELEQEFCADVRKLVMEVTDDKSLSKEERKRLQVENAKFLSNRAKRIKLADKICNIVDITRSPPADWSTERKLKYLSWAEDVVAGCRGVNPGLEQRFDSVVAAARKAIRT